MRIGFVIGTLKYSGAEKIARYLIDALHHQYNHEIGLILISGEGPYPEFDYISQYPIKVSGNMFSRVLRRQKHIRSIVNREKFDVVISFGVKFNIDTMEALKGVPVKVILCERNDPASDPHRWSLRLRRKLAYPHATGFVFQTERIANYFGKKIAGRSAIIPNFIERKGDCLYKEENGNNIVLTARLDDRQKNISMLLHAFKEFLSSHNYELYIVGEGPDEQKLKKKAKELGIDKNVHFTGRQNIYEYLSIAKMFVLPSNYEGMPNSLIEAMAVGLPCIATDCSGGGAAYLIQDHINGTLIPIGGKEELVVALDELASDEKLRQKYSTEAYKINDKLDFEKIIKLWVNYIELVGNNKQ